MRTQSLDLISVLGNVWQQTLCNLVIDWHRYHCVQMRGFFSKMDSINIILCQIYACHE